MIFTAYRLELFKMLKRLAAWITYLCFCLLTALTFGGQFYAAQHSHGRGYFGFPNALPTILTAGTSIASIFGVVLIVLMVCNEFDWKTSRQNIIDGLSKPEWFAGKALLIPTVAVILYLTILFTSA
jgi:ABC-2 type transport system permease protein